MGMGEIDALITAQNQEIEELKEVILNLQADNQMLEKSRDEWRSMAKHFADRIETHANKMQEMSMGDPAHWNSTLTHYSQQLLTLSNSIPSTCPNCGSPTWNGRGCDVCGITIDDLF